MLHDAELVRRAQALVGEYTRQRLAFVAARPGNPLGAEWRRYGDALALIAPRFANPHFNRGYGFNDDQLEGVRETIAWFDAGGVAGGFDLAPGRPIAETAKLLAAAGFIHTGFHATLAGPADLPAAAAPGVEVRCVETEADLQSFSDAYHLGWGHADFRIPMMPWLAAPAWRLYLALADGAPAGAAVLSLDGDAAYLADSAVDPAHRRRRVHRALLDRRCADAAAAGATVIVSGADYLSPSYRNMQRKGLGLLYTEAIWTRASPTN
jgi:ribosomal protein S18 acetylase RimI-like enzyme